MVVPFLIKHLGRTFPPRLQDIGAINAARGANIFQILLHVHHSDRPIAGTCIALPLGDLAMCWRLAHRSAKHIGWQIGMFNRWLPKHPRKQFVGHLAVNPQIVFLVQQFPVFVRGRIVIQYYSK